MYVIDTPREISPAPALSLVWSNPNPPTETEYDSTPLVETRSRRHAKKILNMIGSGYIRERRQGDRLVLSVYKGRAVAPLGLVGHYRHAA